MVLLKRMVNGSMSIKIPEIKLNIGQKCYIVFESKRQRSYRNIIISGFVDKIVITRYNVEYIIKHEKCVNDKTFPLEKFIHYSWANNKTINPVIFDDNKVQGFITIFTDKERCIKWLK